MFNPGVKEEGGRGGGQVMADIQRRSFGGKAVLIALKVTRLRRPTLTRYPYCCHQPKCGSEEQRRLISMIMNGLRPINQLSRLRCSKNMSTIFYNPNPNPVVTTDSLFDLRGQVNTMIMNRPRAHCDKLRGPCSSGNYTQHVQHTQR